MAKREEEEEERKKMKDRPSPGPSIKHTEEDEETIRLPRPEKRKRHTKERESREAWPSFWPGVWPFDKMNSWEMIEGLNKTLYLCFRKYNLSNTVSYSIEALSFSAFGVERVGRCIVGQGRPDMGFGAFGSKLVLAGGVECIFDGYKYRSCPSKDMYVVETEDSNNPIPIKDPRHVFNNTTLQRGKCCPLVAEHDGKLYVLSTFCLKTLAGEAFTGGFEMFDPKVGKWATLPQSPTFGYIQSCRVTSCVVAGSNIFVSTLRCPIYRFDMADPNHQWKQHNFTDCPKFPMRFGCQTLAVETRHGDWVLFTCEEEIHQVADDKDYSKDDNNEIFGDFHPPFEWKGTSMPVYLMSKDLTSLTALEPLKLPHFNILPTFPGRVRSIEHKMVHLGGQNVCLIFSVDTGDESEDGAERKIELFFIMFEFEFVESRRALAGRNFSGPWNFTCDVIQPSDSRATRVDMLGAILL